MESAATLIKEQHNDIYVKTIEFDFSTHNTLQDYNSIIFEKLLNLDVSMLVLNTSFFQPGDFLKIPIEMHRTMFDCSVVPSILMVRLMVDKLLTRKNGMRSGIIYVGCNQSYRHPIPGRATFGACKAFQDFMGTALGFELCDRIDTLSYVCGELKLE